MSLDVRWEAEAIAQALGGKRCADGGWMAHCPAHEDRTPSLHISVRDDRFLVHCFGCGDQVRLVEALKQLNLWPGLTEGGMKPPPIPEPGPASPRHRRYERGEFVCAYVYRTPSGAPWTRTLRFRQPDGSKSFAQQRWDVDHWVSGLEKIETLPYRLPGMLRSVGPVCVTEGEKDADRLAALGLAATTVPCNTWRRHHSAWFAGRHVLIFEDNDPAGEAHALQAHHIISRLAASSRTVRFRDLPTGGDVSDWIDQGNDICEFIAALPSRRPAA